jgi:D-alanyl-D-alanine dipeptidase
MNRFKHTFLIVFFSVFLSFGGFIHANEIELKFIHAGLVDVNSIDGTIQVDLVNSDPQKNFFRENYYHGLNTAYLGKEVALKLSDAQNNLKMKYPGYSLLILDAARPRNVSRMMYDKIKGTTFEKFVANPDKGSMHNYGVAVDITIVDETDHELDMGFSPFGKGTFEIYWLYAKKKLGFKLNDKQRKNCELLTDTMVSAGFTPLSFEWWHFNGIFKSGARKRYQIIE